MSPAAQIAQDSKYPLILSDENNLEKGLQLYRDGDLKESRQILNALDRAGRLNDDGRLVLAYIEFWDGFPSRANMHLSKISIEYHNVSDAEFLRLQIENQLRLKLDMSYGITEDNQPLSSNRVSEVATFL